VRLARATAGLAIVAAGIASLVGGADAQGIAWADFSDQALVEARAAGRPVLIDFQALWCIPCREMEHTTFRDPAIVSAARAFATLKADVSEQDDRTTALMARFNVPGVPTYVLLDGRGEERKRFVGFVAAPELHEALRQVAGDASHG
jgi:thiol:disulfide interchange protein DsbD